MIRESGEEDDYDESREKNTYLSARSKLSQVSTSPRICLGIHCCSPQCSIVHFYLLPGLLAYSSKYHYLLK